MEKFLKMEKLISATAWDLAILSKFICNLKNGTFVENRNSKRLVFNYYYYHSSVSSGFDSIHLETSKGCTAKSTSSLALEKHGKIMEIDGLIVKDCHCVSVRCR